MNPNDTHQRSPSYRLIDFGEGRKLESFGGWIVDRPSPAAEGSRRKSPSRWRHADSYFDAAGKRWKHREGDKTRQMVRFEHFDMPLKATPFGHVGVFPEQAPNWHWLVETGPGPLDCDRSQATSEGLNLFAYTGASTLAMAVSGMPVVHVDAARPNVAAAKAAARCNDLGEHPIRYLVDDAAKFAAREVRRGRRYQTIVLDPPAYGHSPGGKAWRLQRDLWPLLDDCLRLLARETFRLLITGHSPQVQQADVVDYLRPRAAEHFGLTAEQIDGGLSSHRAVLHDLAGRSLDAGFCVRLHHPAS